MRVEIRPVTWVYDDGVAGYPDGVIHILFERAVPDTDIDPVSYVAPEQYRVKVAIIGPPVKVTTTNVRTYSEGVTPPA